MNEITPQAKASFKSRLIVAIFLVLILVPTFFFGGWIYFAVIGVLLSCSPPTHVSTKLPTFIIRR